MQAILFKSVMRPGEDPVVGPQVLLCPIHRSGPRNDLDNYRGMIVMGKLSTAILCDKTTQWATARRLLPETQFASEK